MHGDSIKWECRRVRFQRNATRVLLRIVEVHVRMAGASGWQWKSSWPSVPVITMMPSDVKITVMDRALFAMRRFYNRTFGAHAIGWSHDRLTIFGFSIMSKQTVDALHSKPASENIKAGLSAGEYLEVWQALAMISVLPEPDLPYGTFSDRLMPCSAICLVWHRFYVFST